MWRHVDAASSLSAKVLKVENQISRSGCSGLCVMRYSAPKVRWVPADRLHAVFLSSTSKGTLARFWIPLEAAAECKSTESFVDRGMSSGHMAGSFQILICFCDNVGEEKPRNSGSMCKGD